MELIYINYHLRHWNFSLMCHEAKLDELLAIIQTCGKQVCGLGFQLQTVSCKGQTTALYLNIRKCKLALLYKCSGVGLLHHEHLEIYVRLRSAVKYFLCGDYLQYTFCTVKAE